MSATLAALRAATREIHEDLEGRLVLSAPDAGREAYRAYLGALYGWLAPFEDRLWSAAWPASLEPARRDGKRRWIEDDLHALGLDDAAIAAIPRASLPPLGSLSERFGVAYVVEGSQLGGQVLLRRLSPHLSPLIPRYLAGYGDETGALWRSFVTALSNDVTDDDAAARAAKDTFASLRDWFRARGVA